MSSAFTQTVSRPLLQTYLKCKYFKSVVSQNNRHDLNKVIQQCSRKIATLNIEPKVSLVDERIQTVIKGLKPHEKGNCYLQCMFCLFPPLTLMFEIILI